MEKIYPHSTIGEHIVPYQLVFKRKDTLGHVLSKIKRSTDVWPSTQSVFVLDKEEKLIGAVDFRKLLVGDPNQVLGEITNRDFESLTDHSHQSTAIKLAIKKGVESIPVTDQEGHFLGIMNPEQIFKIMNEEHIERLMHFSGILSSEEFINSSKISFRKALMGRLPWLIVGLSGGVVAAHIIGFFEKTLENQLILATFIPLIVYMADAIGTQTETIFVRNVAIEPLLNLKKFLLKELIVGLTIASICGLLVSLYSFIRFNSPYLGIVLGLSLFCATLIAIVVGTLIPWLINKLKKDPALGTGPLTTVIQDVASVTVYFFIASALL